MTNSNTTIAKNTLLLSIRMVFVLFVSLYTSRVFLNALGVIDYGISNVVAGFVSMFCFLNTSLSNGIQRFYNSEIGKNGDDGVTNVYNTALIIQSVIALVVLLLLETLGLWYFYEKMVIPADRMRVAFWLYQFCAISSVLVIMQSPYVAAIMAYERMNAYAVISIIDVSLKLLFAILLPYIGIDRLMMYGGFYLIVSILNFSLYYLYSKRNFKELYVKKVYNKGMFKEMLSFSGWNLCGTFACMAREQGLNLVLNLFFGPVINAARAVAYQVSGALQGFVSNLSLAAKPQMIQSFATGDSSRTMKLMFSMSKLSFVFLFILSLPILLNVDYVLHLWLGASVPDHAANFVVLVIITNFMNNLNAPLSNVVYATGNMRDYQLTFSIINLLIIPFSYLSLKLGAPAESVFVIYLVMSIIVQIACLLVMRRLVSLSLALYFRKIVLPISVIALLICPILFIINKIIHEGLFRVLVLYAVTTVVSSLAFYAIAMDKDEKNMLKSLLRRYKSLK